MAVFTEQMETLTNELLTSRQERAAFVSDVQQQAHKVLADAQTFMQAVSKEQGARAESLRNDLAKNGQERLRVVKAQRQQNREFLKSMGKQLRETLAQTRRQRQQVVVELRTECVTAQKNLAADLRQAAKVWKRVFQTGATTNGVHTGEVKVTIGTTATTANLSAKAGEAGKSPDHGRRKTADAKQPTPLAIPSGPKDEVKVTAGATVTTANPPVKLTEPGKSPDHARSHVSDPKQPSPLASPGSPPVKVVETGKPHEKP